ncbi:cell division-specific peptidoglycan biosynthesis regulator FtsW [Nitrosomonas cryotolerans]|uniref:Probable peptidoglycan glycosyltransferase FtsW n=1 Tax=Nitrosomonas cryotolerans ATCC 49181 TaxID=1131553 RepID=A0A1N6FM34_9PROT|nr:putative lipid II flippase FtsW [Nitrosomonas cryotolerans]SFP78092.1 cell division-specific peptidoglycan biosynthesis regulator FtsW [Nitrosomonas cryotolerans]SIN96363.1 cell division-specific peptidoglycan biosynthesis regulator FtsW [Nitrosomonas cryotolerans ATCC 49181]
MAHQTHTQYPKILSELDQALVWSVLLLLSLGLVMVYSASIAIAEAKYGVDSAGHYLLRHGAYLTIGLLSGFIVFQIPMYLWQKYAIHLFFLSILLLILVLIPGIGREVNGSQRWISLFVVNLQPSEFTKLFIIMYAADYVVRKTEYLNSFSKGFLPILFALSIVGFLLLLEPDFGAFVVVIALAMAILFLGGMSLKIFVGLISFLAIGLFVLIQSASYRMDRIIAFMDPWADPFGKGYQLSHALIAFGRGEWLGVGLGGSVEKLFYLPEAHTDFLLAVLAEELGFVGVATVIGLFIWLVLRTFVIGRQATKLECHFSALVAQGIGIWIGIQALINMGVNMGVLPTKGLTLPLMSFGGSSITANCIALAVLLRIDWENRQRLKGLPI